MKKGCPCNKVKCLEIVSLKDPRNEEKELRTNKEEREIKLYSKQIVIKQENFKPSKQIFSNDTPTIQVEKVTNIYNKKREVKQNEVKIISKKKNHMTNKKKNKNAEGVNRWKKKKFK